MNEQLIANGQYKLQFGPYGEEGVTALQGMPHLVLSPEPGDGSKWAVAFDGTDSYTLRNVATGIYLGTDSDVSSPTQVLKGVSAPFPWEIERSDGGPEGTFTLSPRASSGTMRLSRSMLLIFPPPVSWLESGTAPQSWRLVKV